MDVRVPLAVEVEMAHVRLLYMAVAVQRRAEHALNKVVKRNEAIQIFPFSKLKIFECLIFL